MYRAATLPYLKWSFKKIVRRVNTWESVIHTQEKRKHTEAVPEEI